MHLLNVGERSVVVRAPPLAGKSNVLRELCEMAQQSEDVAVLLLEPGDSSLFSELSHILSNELNWPISAHEAREWVRHVSNGADAMLVIAIDGLDSSSPTVIADLNAIASQKFGSALRIVIAADDSAVGAIVKKNNGREKTAFGRTVKEVSLKPLNDDEFSGAEKQLSRHRIGVTHGGESVLALREPWILRALVPPEACHSSESERMLLIQPMMDINGLRTAATAVGSDDELQSAMRSAAKAIVDEYLESRSPETVLHGISTFVVDTVRLQSFISESGIQTLRKRGFIKPGISWGGAPVWFIRVPALVATHVSEVVADRIGSCEDSDASAQELIDLSSRLPFGEVIAASALVLRIETRGDQGTLPLIQALLRRTPMRSSLRPGSRFAMTVRDRLLYGAITKSGQLEVRAGGRTVQLKLDPGELENALSAPGGWLILSHVASIPLALRSEECLTPYRLDEALLLEIGQSTVLLSQADGGQGFKGVATHELPDHGTVVCHRSGRC